MGSMPAPVHPDIRELSHIPPLSLPLAAELRHTRKALGHSQYTLADVLGVDRTTLHRWEHGQTRAPSFLIYALQQLRFRAIQRKSVQKRRKREKLLKQSLELSPPVKQKFY